MDNMKSLNCCLLCCACCCFLVIIVLIILFKDSGPKYTVNGFGAPGTDIDIPAGIPIMNVRFPGLPDASFQHHGVIGPG
uniref:Uncharacterized protein n=1 Tax=Mimivirus LCMiAC02 TaxID=2506609 RepID=A0A481Z2V7_9VIRU|nr:MAG: hypothetical protein LCMiAC02_02070 [Mimivirus LCMiAC02]